ncbi:uncharacterized protein CDV56_102219 [Aspergillus thermomutatus]|uniref:Uncharacterized protein n=1 Tax=Aspergillus thermomutatus TaxID=41047 RepID=A0A397G686_ASPTH|nr:uncharacterized protein CDV56_102219 [Aspergillus thermomutatus]RHZ46117.1 hypothetical protein CDV56_102219 [Aspergillus thermomutatus]
MWPLCRWAPDLGVPFDTRAGDTSQMRQLRRWTSPGQSGLPAKIAAMKESKQALADCPTYHRIPLHFRNADNGDKATPQIRLDPVARDGLDASIHAPDEPQEAEPPQHHPQAIIDQELEPARTQTSLQELVEPTRPKRGPGRPKGSRTRPKDQAPPVYDVEHDNIVSKNCLMGEPEDTMDEQPDNSNWFDIHLPQDALPQDTLPQDVLPRDNLQQDDLEDEFTRFTNDVTTINDNDITPEPGLGDLDPESPEYRKLITLKYNRPQTVLVRSSPPAITADAPTIEDPNDEIWHETSERSDDEQLHQ